MTEHDQEPPDDLVKDGRGRSLWLSIVEALELDAHEVALLHEACRTLDTLDVLDDLARTAGVVLRDGRISPWITEARQQRIVFARTIAALRLPEDLADPTRRPQRRAARGAYRPRSPLSLVPKQEHAQ